MEENAEGGAIMTTDKNKKILLVDDEEDILIPIKMTLEDIGFKVDIFTNPLLALSNFKASYYDFAILDIKMPGMNGFELSDKIKKIDDNIKVTFFTATDTPYPSKDYQNVTDKKKFIIKPISLDDMINQVKTQL